MKIDNAILDDIYKEIIVSQKLAKENKDNEEWVYLNGMVHLIETLQSLDKDIDLLNNHDSLKQYALSIIEDLEEDGYDLLEGSYMLQWKYEERPDVAVTLIVGEFVDIEPSNPEDLQ